MSNEDWLWDWCHASELDTVDSATVCAVSLPQLQRDHATALLGMWLSGHWSPPPALRSRLLLQQVEASGDAAHDGSRVCTDHSVLEAAVQGLARMREEISGLRELAGMGKDQALEAKESGDVRAPRVEEELRDACEALSTQLRDILALEEATRLDCDAARAECDDLRRQLAEYEETNKENLATVAKLKQELREAKSRSLVPTGREAMQSDSTVALHTELNALRLFTAKENQQYQARCNELAGEVASLEEALAAARDDVDEARGEADLERTGRLEAEAMLRLSEQKRNDVAKELQAAVSRERRASVVRKKNAALATDTVDAAVECDLTAAEFDALGDKIAELEQEVNTERERGLYAVNDAIVHLQAENQILRGRLAGANECLSKSSPQAKKPGLSAVPHSHFGPRRYR